MGITVIISLPWPSSDLSPNKRQHWASKSKAVAKYRDMCRTTAMLQSVRQQMPKGPWQVSMLFFPPDNRRYDMDNLLARMKAGLDGVCDAIKINDRDFKRTIIEPGTVQKPGSVRIQLETYAPMHYPFVDTPG